MNTKKIINTFRRDIVKYWEDNHCSLSMKLTAANLRISRTTFATIIKVYEDTGRVDADNRGGCRNINITEEQLEFIKAMVDERPSVTFEDIQGGLRLHFELETRPSISGTY